MRNAISRVLLVSIIGVGVCMANTNDDINAYRAQGVAQARIVPHATLDALQSQSLQTQSENKTLIDTLMAQVTRGLPENKRPQAAEGAMLFVSFSMPEPLLFALADEAAAFNIPLVLNGLVEGDFKKTVNTFARLTKEAKKSHLNFQGLSIDPVWFQQFQIQSVPALVVTTRPGECAAQKVCSQQSFDVVYGNASIKKGLQWIAERGVAAPLMAKKILEQGHV